jgi:myo-inositol 2-dehydrogenase / D-chiro-inositol 1-dehydrogenase
MTKQFGLLLVTGNQTHQENYARAFAGDPRCVLIGLADEDNISPRRKELNQELADELDIPYLPNLQTALERSDVDLVSICAEPERRESITIAAAKAGKAIYLDKDPAPTIQSAHAIARAITEHQVASQAFSLVRSPAATRAKAVLDAGEIGDLIGLHCDITFAKGIAGTANLKTPRVEQPHPTRFTFIDSKREFLCTGYYALVLFQWLTGEKFVEVDATTSNYFFAEHQKNDVEDFAYVMLSMQSGIETSITSGRCGWKSHPTHGIFDVRLVGTKGSVTIDGYAPRIQVFNDAPGWEQPALEDDNVAAGQTIAHPEDPMGFWSSTQTAGGIVPKDEWHTVAYGGKSDQARFLDFLESGEPSDVPVGVAAHTVDVVHAAYESAAKCASVLIEDFVSTRI